MLNHSIWEKIGLGRREGGGYPVAVVPSVRVPFLTCLCSPLAGTCGMCCGGCEALRQSTAAVNLKAIQQPTQGVAGSSSLSLPVGQLTLPVFCPSVPGGAFAITVPGPGFQPPVPIVLVCCGGGVAAPTTQFWSATCTPFAAMGFQSRQPGRDFASKQQAGSPGVRRLTVWAGGLNVLETSAATAGRVAAPGALQPSKVTTHARSLRV